MIISPISSFPSEGIQTIRAGFEAKAQAIANARGEERMRAAQLEGQRVSTASETTRKTGNQTVGTQLDALA